VKHIGVEQRIEARVRKSTSVIRPGATIEQSLDSLLASAEAGRLTTQLTNHAEGDLSSLVGARYHGDDQQEAPNKVKS
jgi:hypothetical protein